MGQRLRLPVRGEGLLMVLYWLWTYGVLWRELKAEEVASTSSSLMRQALGWSSGSSCSLCSREHRSRSRRWDAPLKPHWACGHHSMVSAEGFLCSFLTLTLMLELGRWSGNANNSKGHR